jgi:hypothetical protein
MEKVIFDNMKQAATHTGTPYKLLKAAKLRPDAPGFNRSSGSTRIDWSLLKPWLDVHRDELGNQVKEAESLDELKKEELALIIQLKRLELQEKEGRSVDPEDWYQWFASFGAELSTKLKKAQRNIKEQCKGRESVIEDEFLELFTAIQSREDQCKPK